MSEFVSKEALIESFQEIVSEMQDTITEMTKNQSFLNVFEDRDITGTDMAEIVSHGRRANDFQTIVTHLYLKKLYEKNNAWSNDFPFPQTQCTEMYKHIVNIQCPYKALGMPDEDIDSEAPKDCVIEDVVDDWDKEPEQLNEKKWHAKFLTFFHSFFVVWYNFFVISTMDEKLNKNEKKWYSKLFAMVRSFFFHIYFLYKWYFDNDVGSDVSGMHFDECTYAIEIDNCLKNEDYENVYFDWSKARPTPDEVYLDIARCECTLIQSIDDLEASRTLLTSNLCSQSVFLSTQVIEKCLKSILSSYSLTFSLYFNLHDAKELLKHLQNRSQDIPDHPYSRFSDRFETLCHRFESIGADSWTVPNPLSIRCRYFNFQTGRKHKESLYHYYVDSYPGLVYTPDLATEAYEIAEEIFQMSEIIFCEIVENFKG